MALDAQQRRALRSLQLCLDSSLPPRLLEGVNRNDMEAWSALTMLEVRMLIARGQTYQARQLGARLSTAAAAGLAVEPFEGREYPLLINAIDAVLAARHYLALLQLSELIDSAAAVIRWAAHLWLARSLGSVDELAAARKSAGKALQAAQGLADDAAQWAAGFDAELQAQAGEASLAEERVYRVLSYFAGKGDPRGESFAYLCLARVVALAGRHEESDAAAELAYRTDGSWPGPPLRLARQALGAGDMEGARRLLASIPSPTTDAFSLKQALALAEPRAIPPAAFVRYLELADAPPSPEAIAELRELITPHPRFAQASEALFWKLLYRGDIKEAEKQADSLIETAADGTSVVAVRFGLQTFHEKLAKERPPEPEVTGPVVVPRAGSKSAGGFTGQLSLFGVPDLLQFLCGSRRTGLLTFSSQRGDATIRLHEGSLYWATSPRHPSIVAFLVEKQVLQGVAAEKPGDDVTALAQIDGVNLESLADALRESLHLTVKEAVEWSDGWFMFDRVADSSAPKPELLFSAQGILLDALRELDEERR